MLGLGIGGWFWSSGELEKLGPYPTELAISEAMRDYPAARMDVLRYASAALATLGLVLTIMPGRR
jgi:hypothetical protein